jgi:RimJ/RimL family protein N-acetyltransferase
LVTTENQEYLAKWLCKRIDSEFVPNTLSCIGYKINGDIVACCGFEHFNGASVKAHIAVEGYAGMEFYRFICLYPFEQLKAKKIIAPIISTNKRAIRLVQKLGFVIEAVIENYHPEGDAMFLTMTKEQCKILQTSGNPDCSQISEV